MSRNWCDDCDRWRENCICTEIDVAREEGADEVWLKLRTPAEIGALVAELLAELPEEARTTWLSDLKGAIGICPGCGRKGLHGMVCQRDE